jgi:hypothetical protein
MNKKGWSPKKSEQFLDQVHAAIRIRVVHSSFLKPCR